MRRLLTVVAVFAAIAMAAGAACALDGAVKITVKEGVGAYLTDGKDMTLYWFKKDAAGKSACAGACAEKWPVYYAATVKAPDGIGAQDFGIIDREDGKKQTTFRGYPLYYWSGDAKAGETKGNGFNQLWSVIDPANFPPK